MIKFDDYFNNSPTAKIWAKAINTVLDKEQSAFRMKWPTERKGVDKWLGVKNVITMCEKHVNPFGCENLIQITLSGIKGSDANNIANDLSLKPEEWYTEMANILSKAGYNHFQVMYAYDKISPDVRSVVITIGNGVDDATRKEYDNRLKVWIEYSSIDIDSLEFPELEEGDDLLGDLDELGEELDEELDEALEVLDKKLNNGDDQR